MFDKFRRQEPVGGCMPKVTIADLPAKLHKLLAKYSAEDRARAVQATFLLFGESAPGLETSAQTAVASTEPVRKGDTPKDVRSFFAEKAPKNKGEELAVACRFRELTDQGDTHSKNDLSLVFEGARRNFDSSNFARDVDNAKRQTGFFVTGTKRDKNRLSYYGQQFVDAMPNRQATAALRKPPTSKAKSRRTTRATR